MNGTSLDFSVQLHYNPKIQRMMTISRKPLPSSIVPKQFGEMKRRV